MNPREFAEMASKIRALTKALGNGVKSIVSDEQETKVLQRRSIFAIKQIKKDEKITKDNIRLLRPAIGIPPKYIDVVLGRTARHDIDKYDPIDWSAI
jgi:sialic acid synthase SpsE